MCETSNSPAAVRVLGHQAARILDRHPIAGERDHAGAQLQVQLIQWGLEEVLFFGHAALQGLT
jgi:hypothetical protein